MQEKKDELQQMAVLPMYTSETRDASGARLVELAGKNRKELRRLAVIQKYTDATRSAAGARLVELAGKDSRELGRLAMLGKYTEATRTAARNALDAISLRNDHLPVRRRYTMKRSKALIMSSAK